MHQRHLDAERLLVWMLLLAELDVRARKQGFDPPRWHSANIRHGDRANAGLFDRYCDVIPELGRQRQTRQT